MPSGITDVCSITPNILEEPYLLAIPPINFEDTPTIDVEGDGSELLPYNMNVIRDPDPDNDLEFRANGLYVEAGIPGPAGDPGTNGTNGTNGLNGTNGADGTNGTNGAAGADGAGPPVGAIYPIAGVNAPTGTEPLWGQLIARITYPDLFAFAVASGNIITDAAWTGDPLNVGKFSEGDGVNTFRLPNIRGYFLRAWNSNDGGLYPDDDRDLGTTQEDAIRNITGNTITTHDVVRGPTVGAFIGSLGGGGAVMTEPTFDMNDTAGNINFDASNAPGVNVADENRPLNIAYMYVIQAAPVV